MKSASMKKAHSQKTAPVSRRSDPDMRDHYDFSGAVRGKYAARYAAGCNIVRLDLDVFKAFPDSQAVNTALRSLARRQHPKPKNRRTRTHAATL